MPALLADLLTEHRGVVPGEAQIGIGGVAPQSPQRLCPIIVVVQKDERLAPFTKAKTLMS